MVLNQWCSKSAPSPYAKNLYGPPPNDMGSNSHNLMIFFDVPLHDYSQAVLITYKCLEIIFNVFKSIHYTQATQ